MMMLLLRHYQIKVKNYPFWKKCITESGEFKITKSSFYRALKDIRLNQEGSII